MQGLLYPNSCLTFLFYFVVANNSAVNINPVPNPTAKQASC